MSVRQYGLRDDPWARMKDLLPGRDGVAGRPAMNNRLFVEAVLYRYRAEIPWRDLPERFGDFRAVHTRFSRWAALGVLKEIFEPLAIVCSPDSWCDLFGECSCSRLHIESLMLVTS
jgi:transposase